MFIIDFSIQQPTEDQYGIVLIISVALPNWKYLVGQMKGREPEVLILFLSSLPDPPSFSSMFWFHFRFPEAFLFCFREIGMNIQCKYLF